MQAIAYKINCLTNLKVGSREANYAIMDKEAQKDLKTGLPAIYSSTLRGALYSYACEYMLPNIEYIFGSQHDLDIIQTGAYTFFDAKFLVRPLITVGYEKPYILTTSIETVRRLADDLKTFKTGITVPNEAKLDTLLKSVGNHIFTSTPMNHFEIEGEQPKICKADPEVIDWLKILIGEDFAITSNDRLVSFGLPVLVRKPLENRSSEKFLCDEIVPYMSQFYFIALSRDDNPVLTFDHLVQIGENAAIGYGFTQISVL